MEPPVPSCDTVKCWVSPLLLESVSASGNSTDVGAVMLTTTEYSRLRYVISDRLRSSSASCAAFASRRKAV
jgi:hypothetical protein